MTKSSIRSLNLESLLCQYCRICSPSLFHYPCYQPTHFLEALYILCISPSFLFIFLSVFLVWSLFIFFKSNLLLFTSLLIYPLVFCSSDTDSPNQVTKRMTENFPIRGRQPPFSSCGRVFQGIAQPHPSPSHKLPPLPYCGVFQLMKEEHQHNKEICLNFVWKNFKY